MEQGKKKGSLELRERAVRSAVAYLERSGAEVLDFTFERSGERPDILAIEDSDVVAVDVFCSVGRVPETMAPKSARRRLEGVFPWIVGRAPENRTVRFDQVCINVLGDERAMLKRHRNLSGFEDVTNLEWLAKNRPERLLSAFDGEMAAWLMERFAGEETEEAA